MKINKIFGILTLIALIPFGILYLLSFLMWKETPQEIIDKQRENNK